MEGTAFDGALLSVSSWLQARLPQRLPWRSPWRPGHNGLGRLSGRRRRVARSPGAAVGDGLPFLNVAGRAT